MADREDDGPADPPGATEPGRHRVAHLADLSEVTESAEQSSSPGAMEVVEQRVACIAVLGEAAPAAPVLSLWGIDAEGEQASVVDLRSHQDEARAAQVDRPVPSLPPARVVQLRADGRADGRDHRGRTRAPLGEAAGPAELENEPGPSGEAGADATTGYGSGANRRRTGRARGSTGRRTTQRGADQRSPVSEPEIEADPVVVAREICLRLLTERARTRQELAQALRKRGMPDEAANTVLQRFDEVGLIDDAAFAGQWVRSRHTRRGLARRAIAYELRRKGVDEEVAQEALAEVDATSEEQRARELVEHKLRTVPADTPDQRTAAARRLVGMLARRGYSGGVAYRVVREALAAHGADVDDELGTGSDD